MLKQRIAAAEAVAQTIRPAESAVDIAAIESSRVVTTLMEARRSVGVGGGVGTEALGLASRASALIIEAQGLLHQAHAALGPVATSLGLKGREHMYGCEEPPDHAAIPSIVRILLGEGAEGAVAEDAAAD